MTENLDEMHLIIERMKGCGSSSGVVKKSEAVTATHEQAIQYIKTMTRKMRTNPVVKKVDSCTAEHLNKIFGDSEPSDVVATIGNGCVRVKDIEDLLNCNMISTTMIDACSEIVLQGSMEDGYTNENIITLSTYAWRYVKSNNEVGINQWVHRPIVENFKRASHIIIPICHEQVNHYTLLYFDMNCSTWFHADPMIPRTNVIEGECYRDAYKMYKAVIEFAIGLKKDGDHVVSRGSMEVLSMKSGVIQRKYAALSESQIESIVSIESGKLDGPLKFMKDAAQQDSSRPECGLVVMYYMWEIRCGRHLNAKLRRGDMENFTAWLINSICKLARNVN